MPDNPQLREALTEAKDASYQRGYEVTRWSRTKLATAFVSAGLFEAFALWSFDTDPASARYYATLALYPYLAYIVMEGLADILGRWASAYRLAQVARAEATVQVAEAAGAESPDGQT